MLAQFIPHGHCYLWQTNLVGLHLISDFIIAISYYSIPITLIYFVRKRKDLPYPAVFILFGAFIISCGTNHLMEIWTLWHPNYWVSGIIKANTAIISLYTAIEIAFIVPEALKIPSSEQLQFAKNKLEAEIEERKQTEQALQQNESILKSFYNSAPMMMGIAELIDQEDFYYVSNNDTAAAFFGLTSTKMQEKRASELNIPKIIKDRLMAAYLQSNTTFKPVNLEFTYQTNIDTKHFSMTVSKISQKNPEENSRFSYIIEDISDRKQMERVLQESEERFRLAFKDAAVGMAIVSLDGYFLKANRSLCEILGYRETELLSLSFKDITHPEDLATDIKVVSQILEGNINNYHLEKRYFHKSGHEVWIFLSVSLVRDLQKQPQYFIAMVQDITIRKKAEYRINKSLQEKEVMLKEIHHRVKNNLQVICSLLNLQSRQIKEQKLLNYFKETQNRVKSMALVHEQLYQSSNLSQIILLDYVKQLTGNLFRAYSVGNNIVYHTEIEDFNLSLDTAIPCGLIINELISNAIKYAFKDRDNAEIFIKGFSSQQNSLVLQIADNGSGIDQEFDLEKSKSLGLKLVKNLTEQLQGNMKINSSNELGTQFEFIFNRIKKETV